MDHITPTVAFLDLAAQQARLGASLRQRISTVLAHGQFILGPEVGELEQKLAEFCGAAHCVGTSSGTDALQIAMMAEQIGPGDAVFLPAFTYTATAEVPLLLGAKPIFVDINPHTFQIDPVHLEARIKMVLREGKLRPRAVIGVDLFGQPAPWKTINGIASQYGLFTLDDCAQAFGASLNGERLGHMADATATSFFPSKPLGAYGDGGALFTQNMDRAALYRSLRTHGEGTSRYDVQRIGLNGRLDTLQAAVLLAKLEIFENELARREEIAQTYDARLRGTVKIPTRVENSTSAWAIYAVLFESTSARDAAQAALQERGISSAVYYPKPLHHQPAYRDAHDGISLPTAETVARRILALPIHPDLVDEQVERVIAALISI